MRVVALWFNETALFVDEAQYWFWGQNLDLGYFSKPPLIGWVLRAVTDLARSSSPFWVRLPGPALHGITAFLLFLWIRRDGLTFLAVASPNLIWNIANELTTLRHTADNIGWIAPNGTGPGLHFIEMVEFLGSQIGAFGPVFAVMLVLAATSCPMARGSAATCCSPCRSSSW